MPRAPGREQTTQRYSNEDEETTQYCYTNCLCYLRKIQITQKSLLRGTIHRRQWPASHCCCCSWKPKSADTLLISSRRYRRRHRPQMCIFFPCSLEAHVQIARANRDTVSRIERTFFRCRNSPLLLSTTTTKIDLKPSCTSYHELSPLCSTTSSITTLFSNPPDIPPTDNIEHTQL